MRLYIDALSRCLNCDAPCQKAQRFRRGRCPNCYAYFHRHGTENPLAAFKSTRKKVGSDGRLRYGKSCPRCDAFISMRASYCPSCAQIMRHRGTP